MTTKSKLENHLKVSIGDAIDRLSDIVDLDLDGEIVDTPHPIVDSPMAAKKINWLQKEISSDATLEFSREAFRVILNYLKHLFKDGSTYTADASATEHVKTIMVLVGEAAKKLDKYTSLFQKHQARSVTGLVEYKRLQEFYQGKIAHQIDESTLGKWILALARCRIEKVNESPPLQKPLPTLEHVFVDLEVIKKDGDYELFFIRKSDGSRFFHPRLLRNVKLMSDFMARSEGKDLLEEIGSWQDRYLQEEAAAILRSIGSLVEQFYRRALRCKDRELVLQLNKSLMALMLCSYPENQEKEPQSKTASGYFIDFQSFLGELLRSDDYHKLVTYPPNQSNSWTCCLLNLTHALCRSLYVTGRRYQAFIPQLNLLLSSALADRSSEHAEALGYHEIWNRLANGYAAMLKLFKRHPSGAMEKILSMIGSGYYRSFDPMSQMNLPNQLYTVELAGRKVLNLHLPSPTSQEYIDKAAVIDEFKGFLRSYSESSPKSKHLLINLQDRTAWQEHARCLALEGLASHADFESSLAVATLAKDTEFYHQQAPYDADNHAATFLHHFKEHIGDESSGYYFMASCKDEIVNNFAPQAVEAIHLLFFSGKNILLREHRLDFIEIFDLFLVLKLIDLTEPNSFSLTCKDGVDVGASSNALLYIFLKMMSGSAMASDDWDLLNMILYAPAILVRERPIAQAHFNRMLTALKSIELVYRELGPEGFAAAIREAFAPLYSSSILSIPENALKND